MSSLSIRSPDFSPELFLSISDFISVVDLACLSLCSRRLRGLSLRQINLQSPLTEQEKLSDLNRLERDSLEYFACDICNVLHRYDGSESFGLSGFRHDNTCRLPYVDMWFGNPLILDTRYYRSYMPNRLSFLQLKLAMRRFYYGPRAGISTDSDVYPYRFISLSTLLASTNNIYITFHLISHYSLFSSPLLSSFLSLLKNTRTLEKRKPSCPLSPSRPSLFPLPLGK